MHYYHNKDFIKDHELVPDWDFGWESSSKDFDFDVNLNIDGPKHTKDYLDWWQGYNPQNLGIYGIDQVEDEEDVGGA